MRLIEDVGIKKREGGYKERFGIYECPVCKKHFETSTKSVNAKKSTKCKSCSISLISKTHGLSKHPLYKKFYDMNTRCYNKKSKAYKYYGERGISICDKWLNNPELFVIWGLDNGYSKNLEIDRINASGNYEPSNCRFVDNFINAQNKIIKTIRGVHMKKSTKRWCSTITSNTKTYNLGTYINKEDALIAYDLFVIENKTNHSLNGVISENFNKEKWEEKIQLERKKTKEESVLKLMKVNSNDLFLIRSSTKSAYRLSMELPYAKATILKIRNGVTYKHTLE